MGRQSGGQRAQGNIRRRGNSFQVNVDAGLDPLSGRRLYLSESTTSEAEAKRILTRLRAQVDRQRHAKTKATLGYAVDEWLRVQELEQSTRETYEGYLRNHIAPAGRGPLRHRS